MPKLTAAVLFAALISAGFAGTAAAQTMPGASPAPSPAATPAPSPAPAAKPQPASAPKTLYRLPYDGKWHYAVAPYLWGPTINGSIHYSHPAIQQAVGNATADVSTS